MRSVQAHTRVGALMLVVLGVLLVLDASAREGDRQYLDEPSHPYYVSRTFPKLITPQWVGEEGVEAVVVLAIDDMRDPARYEAYLRPILDRLKQIDRRAPVSIMTNVVDVKHPQLAAWLREGLSLEVHTIDHPCPLLRGGSFEKAKSTVDRCVDLMSAIEGNRAVAYRMPCCDSLNAPSPRFFSEIFNKTTERGNFLTIDSSVFNITTANDPDLPRELVLEADGRERFRKYVPFDSFVNTIEDYPYPYVIGKLCWEFPCATPSDWQAQHLHKPNNAKTVEDWKALLDVTVIKQGTMNLVFHPHGWIKAEQLVELVDYAHKKHGKKVKFLTFREAQERLDRHLLGGHPLRDKEGKDNGVRLVDVDEDGLMDVVIDNARVKQTRVWSKGKWVVKEGAAIDVHKRHREVATLPAGLKAEDAGVRFVDIDEDGFDDIIHSDDERYSVHLSVEGKGWKEIIKGKRGEKPAEEEIPPIVSKGMNNGFWVHSRHLWWQNENTDKLPNLVDRRSFNQLLKGVEPKAKSPEASLKSMHVRPGFRVELVAAEPQVMDPIALAFGADGKLWVVEMGDYPNGVDGKGKPGGRVRYLEDDDGDGNYEKSTVFLEGLAFPTGVMPWRDGVLVTCAPEIIYARDTNGDGKADQREVLFSGFGKGNQQHRLNGLYWGLDNWIYGANGDSGGKIKSAKTGAVTSISGRDFRFRPDTGEFDAQTGQTQFGRTRDDWGNDFGCNNPNPIFHFVLADHYLRRNPHIAPPSPVVQVSPTGGLTRVYPISRAVTRFNDPHTLNHFTSACALTFYRDDFFGAGFQSSTFTSEPVHNLVSRMVVEADGLTFKGRRAAGEESAEFLSSSDNWFRPTGMAVGPDGCLYIADMYRQHIEHPEWIPPDWQKDLDLRAGHDKGRIYRVSPVGMKRRVIPRLDKMDTAQLVKALDSASGWQRDTAQRLLVERQDKSKVGMLMALAVHAPARAQTRLAALCTLEGLGSVMEVEVSAALQDEHPGVRRHAVRLCEALKEPWLLREALEARTRDPDPHVRMQLAYTLGALKMPWAGEVLAEVARRDGGDRYIAAAVLSSVNERTLASLAKALAARVSEVAPEQLESVLRIGVAQGNAGALADVVAGISKKSDAFYSDWQFAAAARAGAILEGEALGELAKASPELRAALGDLTALYAEARKEAADASLPPTRRVWAVRTLGRNMKAREEDVALLGSLLAPDVDGTLQSAAVAALGTMRDRAAAQVLLKNWKRHGPGLRGQVLDALLSRNEWTTALLDAVEKKAVLPTDLDAGRRQRLLRHSSSAIRKKAAGLLAELVNADRQKVVEAHAEALTLKGDAQRGREVFSKSCAACHRLADLGQPIGPDLAALGEKSPSSLLIAILDPNRAVEAKYTGYLVETRDDQALTGIITSETSSSITLASAGMGEGGVTFARSAIKAIRSTGTSLMPEGLESGYGAQDLADVIAFVRGASPASWWKAFPGNKPENVRPDDKGIVRLTTATCEIYGKTVVLEERFANLGYWNSEDDQAVWTVNLPAGGRYEVVLDYACHSSSAGNSFLVQAGTSRISGIVQGTGNWETYRRLAVGEVMLPAGRSQVVFRSAGPIAGALIDLRGIELRPAAQR